jgi:hypothetical protein
MGGHVYFRRDAGFRRRNGSFVQYITTLRFPVRIKTVLPPTGETAKIYKQDREREFINKLVEYKFKAIKIQTNARVEIESNGRVAFKKAVLL